jgi:HD-like signal output (HDOD) protein
MIDFDPNNVRDHQLVGRAIRERWSIPKDARDTIGIKLNNIINNPDAPDTTIIRAIDTLAKLDRINVKQEEILTPRMNIHAHLNLMNPEQLKTEEQKLELRIQQLKDQKELYELMNVKLWEHQQIYPFELTA